MILSLLYQGVVGFAYKKNMLNAGIVNFYNFCLQGINTFCRFSCMLPHLHIVLEVSFVIHEDLPKGYGQRWLLAVNQQLLLNHAVGPAYHKAH